MKELPRSATVPVGISALDFMRGLPSFCPGVQGFRFIVYEPTPGLAERLLEAQNQPHGDVLERAAQIRARTDDAIPYGDSVLAAAWASICFESFAAQALRHDPDPHPEHVIRMGAQELAGGRLDDEARRLSGHQVLALNSRCETTDDRQVHLPLMDFRVLPAVGDSAKIAVALRAVGQTRGAILHSGRSFHYYGFDPLTQEEWVAFSAKCLLLSPVTDTRYIGHRLLDGGSSLRVTASPRKPHVPVVVASL